MRARRLRDVHHAHLRRASEYLTSDAVFAVKPTLLREFRDRDAEDPDRPEGVTGAWCSVENDIVLASAE